MKYPHCISLICLAIASCATSKSFQTVKYKFNNTHPVIVSGEIPTQWIDDMRFIRGNDYAISEYLYIYADSSVIYIFNNYKDGSFPNYDNIKNLGTPEASLRLQDDYYVAETNKILIEGGNEPLPQAPHTVDLSGKDHNGLFWRDIKYGDISIGYLGVTVEKKDIYDLALESFHLKP